MILLVVKLIFICSLLVLGITVVTQKDMLLYSVREWAEKRNNRIWEAVILCHWCMSSVWSLIAISFGYGLGLVDFFNYKLLFIYPLVVSGSSIFCGITWTVYLYLSEKNSYYEMKNERLMEEDLMQEMEYFNQIETQN